AVLFSGTYGLRDREGGLPVTPETRFDVCSLTKAFTATALLMASEEGKIDLDRPINESKTLFSLKDPDVTKKVTLNDLLSHRTGLPGHDLLWCCGGSSPNEYLQKISELELLPNSFRRSFNYNNLLYGVIGTLFQEWVGESWESYLEKRVFAPLLMTST